MHLYKESQKKKDEASLSRLSLHPKRHAHHHYVLFPKAAQLFGSPRRAAGIAGASETMLSKLKESDRVSELF
ncbi:hypothetical protein BLNAU_23696 [Blattamonas nauphoetae]|uniref:Uncharacterized protein n=1 Tax=Blattamonas nauphoetae TaxID=2049346 RepID=A0ABQ9WPG6_9EUKA|nr:hypothetical protein BLNAU_23696 [Blattamonas nauphoetae]